MSDSCIIFLVDGARADVTEQMLQQGRLPNIRKYLADRGTQTRAVTAFPSTTGPAYLPFLTGCYPGRCDIPGIRWFDRQKYNSRGRLSSNRFRSYMGLGTYFMNADISKDVRTLFELCRRPISIFSPISRGAGLLGNKTKLASGLLGLFAHLTDRWEIVDRVAGSILASALAREPGFVYAVFPAVDELAHLSNPFSERVAIVYEAVDAVVGRVARYLERKGVLGSVTMILTSDHGLSSTHTHFDLTGYLEGRGMRTLHYPLFWRRRFDAAVMVSGNAMAHVYLKGPGGWEQPVRHREIHCVDPQLVRDLARLPAVAWVATRDDNCGVRVTGDSGEGVVFEEEGWITYQTSGEDPLGYRSIPERMSDRASLNLTFDTDYPDGLVQLLQVFKSRRSGDIVVNADIGFDLRDRYERPEHRSSHGSLHRDHMLVPLLINRPIRTSAVRTVDVFPSVLRLMGIPVCPDVDGVSFA